MENPYKDGNCIKNYIIFELPLRKEHKDCIIWLDKYLEDYLKVVRDVLQIEKKKVRVISEICGLNIEPDPQDVDILNQVSFPF